MKKFVVALFVLALGMGGGVAYLQPHLALKGIQTAIQTNDPAAFEAHADFPTLRENLKAQLAKKAEELRSKMPGPAAAADAQAAPGAAAPEAPPLPPKPALDLPKPGGPLGHLGDRVREKVGEPPAAGLPAGAPPAGNPAEALAKKMIDNAFEELVTPQNVLDLIHQQKAKIESVDLAYISASEFHAVAKNDQGQVITLILTRQGGLTWKLTNVLLPV